MFYKAAKQNPCSLLQIAARNADGKEEVFVLDLLTLPPKMYNSTLCEVFLSKSIVKLGQGFYQDLKELALAYPKASCFRVAKSVVEVNDLSIALVGGGHFPLSLQKLVFLYLHCKLTKTQQTSNWNRRPLAPGQLHYAAADALVLIHLYDELMKRMALAAPSFQIGSVMNVLDVHVPPAPKCSLCFDSFDSIAALKAHRKVCTASVRTLEICVSCDEKKLVTAEAMQQHVSECSEAGSDDTSRVVVVESAKKPAASTVAVVASRKRSLSVTEPVADTTATKPKQKQQSKSGQPRKQQEHPQQQSKKPLNAKNALASVLMQAQRTEVVNAIEALRLKKSKQANAQTVEQKLKGKSKAAPVVKAAPATATDAPTESKSAGKKKRRKQRSKKLSAVELQPQALSQQQTPLKQRKMSVESSLLASDAIWSQVSTDNSSSMFSP